MTDGLIANRLVDVRLVLHEDSDEPHFLSISAFDIERGFTQSRLVRDEGTDFDAAWRFLNRSNEADLARLDLANLQRCGLVVDAQAHGPRFVGQPTATGDAFARSGYALLPRCLTSAALAGINAFYRDQIAVGAFARGDRQSDRFGARNDPAARIVQRLLEPDVARIVGQPVQCSYSYASLYCEGAELPRHKDRLQSEYALSLLIDSEPAAAAAPLLLYLDSEDAPPVACDQPIGGGVLFRGRRIPHARRPLPPGARCWVMVLNYVDADFDSSLD